LARYSLYKLNRVGDKQHPCLTPLLICKLLVSPPSSRMYSLLNYLLSRQSIPLIFRICINLVQLPNKKHYYSLLFIGDAILSHAMKEHEWGGVKTPFILYFGTRWN
jgi:hypothetical protein